MPHRPIAGATAAALLVLVISSGCAHRREEVAVAPPSPARDTAVVSRAPEPVRAARAGEVREYTGAFSSGYEVSWFEPCGAPRGDSRWWVTLTEEARLQRDSLLARLPVRPHHGLAVRWRGSVSEKIPGGAGHMGQGSRYMLVTRIVDLRPLDEDGNGACGPLDRVGL